MEIKNKKKEEGVCVQLEEGLDHYSRKKVKVLFANLVTFRMFAWQTGTAVYYEW